MSRHTLNPTLTRTGRAGRAALVTLGGLGGAAALALATAAPASAHVTITPTDTAAGSYTVLTVSNGHGCEGSPTTQITISMPEGINQVTPTRQPFYEVEKVMEDLDEPITDGHGNEITERVSEVVYTADTALPDGYRDAFELSLQLPDAPGETLAFPAVQTCEEGETAWVETAADGQDPEELERPAPTLTITEAEEGAEGASAEQTSAEGGETAAEATDEGGSNALALTGLGVGVLGVVVGGVALAQARRRS